MRENSQPALEVQRYQESIEEAIGFLKSLERQHSTIIPEGKLTLPEKKILFKILNELRENSEPDAKTFYKKIEKQIHGKDIRPKLAQSLDRSLLRILRQGLPKLSHEFVPPSPPEPPAEEKRTESLLKKALQTLFIHATLGDFTTRETQRYEKLKNIVEELDTKEKRREELEYFCGVYLPEAKSETFRQFLQNINRTLDLFGQKEGTISVSRTPSPEPPAPKQRTVRIEPPQVTKVVHIESPDPQLPSEVLEAQYGVLVNEKPDLPKVTVIRTRKEPLPPNENTVEYRYGRGGASDLPKIAPAAESESIDTSHIPPDGFIPPNLPVAPEDHLPFEESADEADLDITSTNPYFKAAQGLETPVVSPTEPLPDLVHPETKHEHQTTDPIPDFSGPTFAPQPIEPEPVEPEPTAENQLETPTSRFVGKTAEQMAADAHREFEDFDTGWDEFNEVEQAALDKIEANRAKEQHTVIEFETPNGCHAKYTGPIDGEGKAHTDRKIDEKGQEMIVKATIEITKPVFHPDGVVIPIETWRIRAEFNHGDILQPVDIAYTNNHGTDIQVEGTIDENYLPDGAAEAHYGDLLFSGQYDQGTPTRGRTYRVVTQEIEKGPKKGQEETVYLPLHTSEHNVDIDLLPTDDAGNPISVYPTPRRATGSLRHVGELHPAVVERGAQLFPQHTTVDSSVSENLQMGEDSSPSWKPDGPTMLVENINEFLAASHEQLSPEPTPEPNEDAAETLERETSPKEPLIARFNEILSSALADLPENGNSYREREREMVQNFVTIVKGNAADLFALVHDIETYVMIVEEYIGDNDLNAFSARFVLQFLPDITRTCEEWTLEHPQPRRTTDKLFGDLQEITDTGEHSPILHRLQERANKRYPGIGEVLPDVYRRFVGTEPRDAKSDLQDIIGVLAILGNTEVKDIHSGAEQNLLRATLYDFLIHEGRDGHETHLLVSHILELLQQAVPEVEPPARPEASSEVLRLRADVNDLMSKIQTRSREEVHRLAPAEIRAFHRLTARMRGIVEIQDLVGAIFLEQLSFDSQVPAPRTDLFKIFVTRLNEMLTRWQDRYRTEKLPQLRRVPTEPTAHPPGGEPDKGGVFDSIPETDPPTIVDKATNIPDPTDPTEEDTFATATEEESRLAAKTTAAAAGAPDLGSFAEAPKGAIGMQIAELRARHTEAFAELNPREHYFVTRFIEFREQLNQKWLTDDNFRKLVGDLWKDIVAYQETVGLSQGFKNLLRVINRQYLSGADWKMVRVLTGGEPTATPTPEPVSPPDLGPEKSPREMLRTKIRETLGPKFAALIPEIFYVHFTDRAQLQRNPLISYISQLRSELDAQLREQEISIRDIKDALAHAPERIALFPKTRALEARRAAIRKNPLVQLHTAYGYMLKNIESLVVK